MYLSITRQGSIDNRVIVLHNTLMTEDLLRQTDDTAEVIPEMINVKYFRFSLERAGSRIEERLDESENPLEDQRRITIYKNLISVVDQLETELAVTSKFSTFVQRLTTIVRERFSGNAEEILRLFTDAVSSYMGSQSRVNIREKADTETLRIHLATERFKALVEDLQAPSSGSASIDPDTTQPSS